MRARRRVIDLGDRFGAGIFRTQPRLVRQVLERIVMPELDLDAPVHGPALRRVVGGHRLRRSLAVAFDRDIGQPQSVLDGEGNAPGHRLRQPQLVAVDALVAPFQRGVVGIGGELDDDILLAFQIDQRLSDLLQKFFRHGHHALFVMHGRNQVLDAGTMGMAFLVTQFADRLGAADLDAVHLPGDDHFLFDHLFADLVIPDLNLHPPVERPAGLGRIAGDRLAVTQPLIGDGFRGKPEGALAIFGGGARPFPGQAGIVAVFRLQGAAERLGIGVADKVKTHIGAIAHAFEHAAQKRHILLGNVRLTLCGNGWAGPHSPA